MRRVHHRRYDPGRWRAHPGDGLECDRRGWKHTEAWIARSNEGAERVDCLRPAGRRSGRLERFPICLTRRRWGSFWESARPATLPRRQPLGVTHARRLFVRPA
jgi:hypothetical protein